MGAALTATGRRLAAALCLLAAACSGSPPPEAPPSPSAEPLELSDARWEGRWEFDYTLVSLRGTGSGDTSFQPGQTIRRIWEVRPGCRDRPCNSQIVATNPDEPEAGAVVSVVTYRDGVYRIEQIFGEEVTNSCEASDGTVIPDAFEASNVVEVTPEEFEVVEGRAVVTAMTATKTTAFTPVGVAAGAGGTCVPKVAEWEARVTPATASEG